MASLTKIVAMTSSVMQLVEQGRIDLDAPVQKYLPEWTGPNKDKVTIRHLLTHSSGMPGWRALYKEATSPEQAMQIVMQTPLDTVPGVRMVYSDLGAILMGQVLLRVSGQRVDAYARDHVFGPLKMTDTQFLPDKSLLPRIAPTEVDPWRQRQIHGEVHDENAVRARRSLNACRAVLHRARRDAPGPGLPERGHARRRRASGVRRRSGCSPPCRTRPFPIARWGGRLPTAPIPPGGS